MVKNWNFLEKEKSTMQQFLAMMSLQPLLTIVITNYNHGKYFPKAIDCLVSQDFFPFEILIIDDASTDNSLEIINKYASQYSFIRVIAHKKNQGVCFALCEGIEEAKGTYVHTMGADDYRLPGFIKKTMTVLLEQPHIGVACSNFGYITGHTNEGPILTEKLIESFSAPVIFDSREILRVFQTTHLWVPGHTAILKRESALKYKKYDQSLKFLCDWFLLHQIALNEGVIYIPETLSVWWIHPSSYSANLLQDKKSKKTVYRNLFQLLFESKDQKTSQLFIKSTLLRVAFNALFAEIFYKPKYWISFVFFLRKSMSLRWEFIQGKIESWKKSIIGETA